MGLFFLSFVASFIFLLPQIVLKYPNLLVIAETWSFEKDIVGNTLREFTNSERFRPLYAFQRTIQNVDHQKLSFYSKLRSQ